MDLKLDVDKAKIMVSDRDEESSTCNVKINKNTWKIERKNGMQSECGKHEKRLNGLPEECMWTEQK